MVTHSTFRNKHICFNFFISFNRNRTFAATRYVPWALNIPRMHLQLQTHFGALRAQGTCLAAANVISLAAGS